MHLVVAARRSSDRAGSCLLVYHLLDQRNLHSVLIDSLGHVKSDLFLNAALARSEHEITLLKETPVQLLIRQHLLILHVIFVISIQ